MRKIIIPLLMICVLAFNANAKNIQTIVKSFGKDTTFRYSASAVSIYDIKLNKEIAKYNSSIINVPASTMKTVTFATVLAILGEDFQFSTKIKMVGKLDASGVLNGDIIIEPGCDPTLGSEHFSVTRNFKSTLLNKIKELGITKINGKIKVLSDGIMTDGLNVNWTVDDVAWEYGATTFDFNYADNKFRLPIEIKNGGLTVGKPNHNIPNLKVRNEIIFVPNNFSSGMRGPDIIRGINSDEIILTGTVLKDGGKRKISCSMKNPAEVFVNDFTEYLIENEIYVANKRNNNIKDTTLILDYKSPKLKYIAKSALERSDNMFTQTMLLEMSKKKYGIRDSKLGVKVVKNYWKDKGLNIKELFMVDGSGLARKNGATARFFSKMLAVAQKSGLGRKIDFASYLPKLGKDGTVQSLLKKTKYRGRIAMKSGSMSNVQCYTGYFPVDNPRYTITIMINNFLGSRRKLSKKIEAFLLEAMPALEASPQKR